MHRHPRSLATTLCLFAVLAAQALASPILYYTPTTLSNGLGRPSSSQFTATVVSTFGAGNVVEIPTFNNAADFDDGSVLFVNAREGTDVLSAQEQANLLAFANAGGAVFFIGDHLGWTTWDNSFLNLFGDTMIAWNGVNAALATNALPGFIAANTQIALNAPGAISGGNGTALFTVFANGQGRSMASIYGPADNVIAFLDTNAFSGGNNQDLYTGISAWLHATGSDYEEAQNASAVPDAGFTVWLLAPVLLGLAGLRRRGRVMSA